LGWGDKDVLVLHVGRFDEQKNHEAVVTIFHRVIQQKPYARLVMVGDGPLRPIIERRVRELGLEDKARFLGHRDDVPAIMSVSDVFVFPSINEGFGIVAIEAAAAGLPVVASRVPGLTEVVRHKETGVLCDLHDIAGMVEAVNTLIEDESMRSQMGAAGRRWVSDNFSEEHMVREYLDVYEGVLDRWQKGKRGQL
jgi:glycosyltransferase involved in cell wall biosynthesis